MVSDSEADSGVRKKVKKIKSSPETFQRLQLERRRVVRNEVQNKGSQGLRKVSNY